ncbi:MAG: FAD-dependent oxidoreductase [Verrucomicrobiae bacterium]|nr:FAD-dependent oxidoreductase [Verrucomicrobiae bacterium]
MKLTHFPNTFLILALSLLWIFPGCSKKPESYDLVIYGGTAGGIVSAISAAREGMSVAILEPSEHVGGMVTGGLGRTDIGVWQTIGGMSAEFYQRVKKHYDDPAAWKFQTRDDYLEKNNLVDRLAGSEWWYHEPSVAAKIFNEMLAEENLEVLTGYRLQSVDKAGARIVSLSCENGTTFSGKIFIDATYEGDLMAMAGVSYHVGREPAAQYGEKFAGVLPWEYTTRKQWDVDVNPYDEQGKLLYGIQDVERGEVGAGDRKVQAYNYRICLTDHPDNRVPITKPDNYDPSRYDLLARYVKVRGGLPVNKTRDSWGFLNYGMLPNRKTDINDGGPFSTDFIGMNWDYPEGDQATREAILQEHLDFTKGLLYFIGHDPRVPEATRNEMLQWGYPKDEFTDNGHWTPQLYVREARRMVGSYVITSHDIETNRTKEDSIGMGSYGADSHLCQRIAWEGVVRNEGNPNDFTPGHNPWEIPYRSITPKKEECENLLVTFCVSASHMGFASVRMEPVFMIVGESAGLAAKIALDGGFAIQDVPYKLLHPKLVERKQKLKLEDVKGH